MLKVKFLNFFRVSSLSQYFTEPRGTDTVNRPRGWSYIREPPSPVQHKWKLKGPDSERV